VAATWKFLARAANQLHLTQTDANQPLEPPGKELGKTKSESHLSFAAKTPIVPDFGRGKHFYDCRPAWFRNTSLPPMRKQEEPLNLGGVNLQSRRFSVHFALLRELLGPDSPCSFFGLLTNFGRKSLQKHRKSFIGADKWARWTRNANGFFLLKLRAAGAFMNSENHRTFWKAPDQRSIKTRRQVSNRVLN